MPRGGQSISFCHTHFTTGDRIYVYGLVKGLDTDRCAVVSSPPPQFSTEVVQNGYEMVTSQAATAALEEATSQPNSMQGGVSASMTTSALSNNKKSGRVFALSNTLEVTGDVSHYKCQLYIPVSLPPSIRRPGRFSYDYVLAIRNDNPQILSSSIAAGIAHSLSLVNRSSPVADRSASGGSNTLRNLPPARASTLDSIDSEISAPHSNGNPANAILPQISLSISVSPCPVMINPLTEWIPTFMKFTQLANMILQPPPIYPPLPARPYSPTYLALLWDFGAAFTSGSYPVPLPIAGWSHNDPDSQQEFKNAKEKVDAGLLYLKWLSYTCADMLHSTLNEPRCANHMTSTGVTAGALAEFLEEPEECTNLLRLKIQQRAVQEVNLIDRLGTGFEVDKLISSIKLMNLTRGSRSAAGNFVSSFEADGQMRPQMTPVYRVSVNNSYLSDIQIVNVWPAEISLPTPVSKVYEGTKVPPVTSDDCYTLEGNLGSTIYVKTEFTNSSLAVVEVCVRLKQTTRSYQPPLSPLEAIQWHRHRQSMGYKANAAGGLSWLDFRSYHTLTNIDSTLIVISSETVSVCEASTTVTQTTTALVPLYIPATLDATFRHERVGVSYELEIEFTAIACHGQVLDLTSRTDNGKHQPFITINGPLLPRSTSKIAWTTALILRPFKMPTTEMILH